MNPKRNVRLPADLHRRLKIKAAERDLSLDAILEIAVQDWLDHHDRQQQSNEAQDLIAS